METLRQLDWLEEIPSNGIPTSDAAASSMEGHTQTIAEKILAYLEAAGAAGATSDEVEEALKIPHQTVSPRILYLRHLGKVQDSGQRRTTRSGRSAICWVAR